MNTENSAPASEWTFEEAQKHWQPMTRAVQHVGVPGYEWQAAVLWDGSLVFGPLHRPASGAIVEEAAALGDNLLHVAVGFGECMQFADRDGRGSPAVRRWLDDGRLPIPHVETRDGGLTWHETVFAHLFDRGLEDGLEPRADDLLVVHAQLEVCNTGDRAETGHLWLHFGDTGSVQFGYKAAVGEELGASVVSSFEPPLGIGDDKVRYAIPAPTKGEIVFHEAEGLVEWKVMLDPGEEAVLRIIVPYAPVERRVGERFAALDTDAMLTDVRRFWRGVVAGASVITTPDGFVNDYAAAVASQLAQQLGYRHQQGVWMYKTSPNHYEHYWPCNAAKALPTLDLRGLTHFSRPVLQSFVDTQSDDFGQLLKERRAAEKGKELGGEGFERRHGFLGNFGSWTANTLLLSHGLELWAMASHYRITRDDDWLGEGPGSPLQALLDGCDWLAAQRRRTMREENGEKVPHWGLLPAASAHDWLSGNTIFNDAFCIFGMIETVRLLREVGHPRAEDLAGELNSYRACLRERYVAARDRARPVPLPDGGELPYVPRDVGELDWATIDWTYTGYGPPRAGAWGALDPHDELVDQSLAFLAAGMPKGEGFYMRIVENTADENWRDISDPEADRHFLWKHYVEYETMWPIGNDLFLQRDDLPRFFEWFFNNLAVVLHHDWRVGVESLDGVPSCAPGDGERWRAIRNMFVNERGGYDGSQQSLWLLQAIPRSWLTLGSRLSAKDMRTHFGGHIDLDVEVSEDGRTLAVSVEHQLKVQPTEIRLRLRSGDSGPLKSVEVNEAKASVSSDDTIALPARTEGRYRVIARYA